MFGGIVGSGHTLVTKISGHLLQIFFKEGDYLLNRGADKLPLALDDLLDPPFNNLG